MKFAKRVETVTSVHWRSTGELIRAREAEGVKVIQLGSGNPDLPTPPAIIEALCQAAQDPTYHRYPFSFRTGLEGAIADWYGRRFGVELDPTTEVIPLDGSQAGISSLNLAVMEPGAVALVTDPAFGSYTRSAQFSGGEVYRLPLFQETGYLPDLAAIPSEVLARTRLLWLNYPNNPTGAVAPLSFFEQVVAFAREHDILVCHDNAYCDVTYDGYVAPSFLAVEGAKEVGIEMNSLSKGFNMAGWRMGMAVGNAEALSALSRVRRNSMIGGHIGAIQMAAIEALTGDPSWVTERDRVYHERREIVVEGLRAAGFEVAYPQGTVFVWARLPEGYHDSREFSMKVLYEANVWITSGIYFGEQGEGHVRVSLTEPTEDLREAMERLKGLNLSEGR
jgi:LL-diaminopimelate aminotransferase